MQYDVIIIGGGLVGAGLAASLKSSKLRIALIDAKLPSSNDPRLFALNETSCTFLENLNVWHDLSVHASPIHQVHVSSRGQFGAVRLDKSDISRASLGHVIPAYHIESALNAILTTLPNVTIYRPATLTQLKQSMTEDGQHKNEIEIRVQDELMTLEAPLVIGADGADSSVRQFVNIEAEHVDYAETAIVTRTTLQRSHQHIAYERFNKHGAIAMLPLAENECATIWTTSNAEAGTLLALSDTAFLEALQSEFGYRLGRFKQIGVRHHFPLRMVRAKQSVQHGAILLGNAAHTLHPIAAQGFNLALFEVALLAEALQDGVHIDLNAFHQKVKNQMQTSVAVSHRLSRLFQQASPFLRAFIPFGLIGMDKCPPARRLFINKMMGRNSDMPSLLQSEGER